MNTSLQDTKQQSNSSPLLTIIIPHYNIPHMLKKLLDTIPVRDDIQVIVIDDNSNVELEFYASLIIKYPHVTFLTNETGVNSAGTCRNTGLNHATGRWVLFADADDYFTDDFLSIISEYVESDYDTVYFSPTSIDLTTGNKSDRHVRRRRCRDRNGKSY